MKDPEDEDDDWFLKDIEEFVAPPNEVKKTRICDAIEPENHNPFLDLIHSGEYPRRAFLQVLNSTHLQVLVLVEHIPNRD